MFWFYLMLALYVGAGQSCVTDDNKNNLNGLVQGIIDELVNESLAMQNTSTQKVEVLPQKVPDVLTTLCNSTTLKNGMLRIAEAIGQCSQLLVANDTKLHLLELGGVRFSQFLLAFPQGVDQFCKCIGGLPNAWALKADSTVLQYTEPEAAFVEIANVENICGDTIKGLIVSVGGASTDCKEALKGQAGVADDNKFDGRYDIAKTCSTSTDSDWDCMKKAAKVDDFKTCISDENNKVGDEALCGKFNCVSTWMTNCTEAARKLYIKAVNVENTEGIKEDNKGCGDGTSGLRFSLLAILACLLLLWV